MRGLALAGDGSAVHVSNYQVWREQFIAQRLRVLYLVGLIVNPIFGALDALAYPEHLRELLLLRGVLEFGLCIGFIALRFQLALVKPEVLLALWILIPNICIAHMFLVLSEFNSTYYNGLALVMLTAAVIVPVSWMSHLVAQIGTLLYFYGALMVHGLTVMHPRLLAESIFFLVFFCVAFQISLHLYERLQKREFLAKRELEASNDKLQALDRLKSEFFANISHELRTPLTVSLGAFKQALKSSLAPSLQSVLESGLRNTARLLFLINELLELSKFESGHTEIKRVCIDFRMLVTNVASNFESSERQRIFIEAPSEPLPLAVDVRRMVKVMYNLLANAFKFSDPQLGNVWIRITSQEHQVILEIEDNGIGISEDHIDQIFGRFYQVEGHLSRRYEGSGIGLALAKEIVVLHGGSIAVRSAVGKGSTFTVTLPRGQEHQGQMVAIEGEDIGDIPINIPDGTTRHAVPASDHDSHDGSTVLVVDDNADMRAYLTRLLSDTYHVIVACNGADALEKVRAQVPDLVVADMMMPLMSGYDLLKAIRATEGLKTLPFIMLTARAGTEARVETYEAGADDYVTKPFGEEELLARISNQLRLHRQERELELQTAELRQLASQLERANAELRELSQRKSEFVGIVSHDLRTPLTAMITLLDNLLEGLAGSLNEKQKQYLLRINNNGWRLIRMINDLLDIAKIESGAINFDPKALDLAAFLENLVDGLRSVTQEKGVRLQALLNGPAWSKADSDKLHQVFTNLIDNAAKFTKAGGEVRVELNTDGKDFVRICVSDTGCGISPEDLPHVFEKFYRGRDRHSARGAGLGLAIVKHYVELHGGRIWVESAPQEGSRFYVEIPRIAPAVQDS
ncbi:MAG: hypothetical protein NTNFB02_00570 [Nitrospira sp.]